ncbi:MAG: hypothetical protein SW127_18405 [Actinomycetota bacterium]|nr:hypothetical protein [Actinomycetota bacterium]
MAKYAQYTTVPIERSQAEMKKTLARYGARNIATLDGDHEHAIAFVYGGWLVRMKLPMPENDDRERRRLWRSFNLIVKAKLEAIENGVSTFEREFLPDLVIPATGTTVGEWMQPQWPALAAGEQQLPMLPAPA